MRGLWLVARREIVTRGTSKSYLISLAASVVLVVALVLVPGLLSSETRYTVALTGQDSVELEAAIDAASEGFDAFTVDVEQVGTPDEARNLVSEGEVDVAIVDNQTLITESGANQDLSLLLDSVHQQVGSQRQLSDAGFDVNDVQAALAVAPMEQEHLGGSDMGARIGFGYILVIVLFFMVIMPVMYVATGVVEEKSSRIVEILLTSLKSWQLLGGKIVGLGVLGFLNLAVPLAVGLGIGGFTDSLDFLPTGVTSTLISAVAWWALAFAFYSALAGSLSSLVSRQEDINSAIGPMTMLMVVTYVVATIYVWDPTSTVTRVLSFIPPFSVFMMPVRDIVNDAPVWQQLVSGAIMMVAVVAVLALGATIYKRSVMRTGSKIKLMDVLRKGG
ncbi:ABC-2 type transport system permease protein [Stackebrandtia endophytica]|uniref:ABC-2 type transport system permease protein n=1 Tax=Stackebrandtia endophytica TaxID=1496996 RepID=A0A543AZG8_9ACTN|nr:ABC transporter permease [Stackebrandtia endophytica]TQL77961.1 ABC-2 type transport system permease protein [Stackebrandtia endophytica]